MRTARALPVLLAFVLAGCVGSPVVWHGAPAPASTLPDCTLAPRMASEFDRPPLEIVPLLDEKTEPEEAPPPAPPARPIGAKARWGVRFGSLNTVGGSYDWKTTGFLGLFVRDSRPSLPRFAYEVGFDIANVPGAAAGATVSSNVSVLRLDMLFGKWNEGDDRAAVYALFGAGIGGERTTWELTGITQDVNTPVIDIGFGLTGSDASWDARFGYTGYAGTGARGAVTVGLGLGF